MIRVLIYDGLRIFRETLTEALERISDLRVVETTSGLEETLSRINERHPDVVLLRAAHPQSLFALRAISEASPDVRVVALDVSEVEEEIIACAEAGASGFVPRDGSIDDLGNAIQSVARGEIRCSPRITAALLRHVGQLAAERHSKSAIAQLTPREREVARLLEEGLSNKEIAQRLSLAIPTVKNHLHSIIEKLEVHSRGEVVARFRQLPARMAIAKPSA